MYLLALDTSLLRVVMMRDHAARRSASQSMPPTDIVSGDTTRDRAADATLAECRLSDNGGDHNSDHRGFLAHRL